MTGQLAVNDARALTDQIKTGVEAVWHLITRAYIERAWSALGYTSWDDYCTREFGTSRLRLPREERAEVVSSLRDSGLSLRAIASATGYSEPTIRRELSGASNDAPEPRIDLSKFSDQPKSEEGMCLHCGAVLPLSQLCEIDHGYECDACVTPSEPIPSPGRPVTGMDGKTYQSPSTPKEQRRKAITESFNSATYEFRRSVERIARLSKDDRFPPNSNQLAESHLSDLVRGREEINRIINLLEASA